MHKKAEGEETNCTTHSATECMCEDFPILIYTLCTCGVCESIYFSFSGGSMRPADDDGSERAHLGARSRERIGASERHRCLTGFGI